MCAMTNDLRGGVTVKVRRHRSCGCGLTAHQLPSKPGKRSARRQQHLQVFDARGEVRPLEAIRNDVVRIAIREAGSVSGAARLLGLGRSTLYRWRQGSYPRDVPLVAEGRSKR